MTKKYKVKDLPLFDPSEYLDDEESIAIYLDLTLKEANPSEFQHALGVVAKARGMTDIARKSGISREALYRALSNNSAPRFETIFKVMQALGLQLSIQQKTPEQKTAVEEEQIIETI
ncbi:addiction module antidote protein [Suttonella ornithocola]|uniref:Predicted transcriptional regulator n=1 Tax=Suttonella ornithocola TaxID=279832 RepID=A0A380MUA2_9GAMM|nr:addiction module antidote protein [Suttonella ornithocola]SUO96155.1 Predicted transcriptional regulator [Suttonella ornithocola]